MGSSACAAGVDDFVHYVCHHPVSCVVGLVVHTHLQAALPAGFAALLSKSAICLGNLGVSTLVAVELGSDHPAEGELLPVTATFKNKNAEVSPGHL
jgi:hypothetical protein